MAKKSKNKTVTVVGTPTALLLPSRNYKFNAHTDMHKMIVPRNGKYSDLDAELFDEKSGEFDILHHSEEDGTYTLFIPTLSKLLFATHQYPDMHDGEAFAPISIKIKEDEVEITGNLIEMIPQEK